MPKYKPEVVKARLKFAKSVGWDHIACAGEWNVSRYAAKYFIRTYRPRKKKERPEYENQRLADLQVKDYKRLLQPVIDGNEIMELFHLQPSREVGVLKQYLKDAVLDNKVENEREPLMQLLLEKAAQMGLKTN